MNQQEISVDLTTNCITIRGKEVKLRRQEAELAYVLAKQMPGGARKAQIFIALWGASEGKDPGSHVCVVAVGLRRKIKPYGLSVQSIHSVGYRLVWCVESNEVRHAA